MREINQKYDVRLINKPREVSSLSFSLECFKIKLVIAVIASNFSFYTINLLFNAEAIETDIQTENLAAVHWKFT